MRDAEIEVRVRNAVNSLRIGSNGEDDAVEFKAQWPSPPEDAARQLAGGGNLRAGEPLIFVIGVHDRTGAATHPERVEPADWYAQLRSRFDERLAPELERTMLVSVDEDTQVTALVFGTSRAPYVVSVPGLTGYMEVPMRRGTGTQSASRRDLMQLLAPTVDAPSISVASANASSHWYHGPSLGVDDAGVEILVLRLPVRVSVYIANTTARPVTLPTKFMQGRVRLGDNHIVSTAAVRYPRMQSLARAMRKDPPEPVPQHGLYVHENHATILTSGSLHLEFNQRVPDEYVSASPRQVFDFLSTTETLDVEVAIKVAGVHRYVTCRCGSTG